jgi:cell fate regulator YaaT (PSP1 superfamily)
VRDEARRLDGVGRCGRQYCSASWLPELRPVNLGVAKDQRLSLNPAQISGACGRLMCCLRYEHEFYVQSRKRFPKEGKIVTTARGDEKVMSIDIFRERLTLRSAEGESRAITLNDYKRELAALSGEIVEAEVEDTNGVSEEAYAIEGLDEEIAFASEEVIASDAPAESAPQKTERDESTRRRRGRRGGRRGRGGDSGQN